MKKQVVALGLLLTLFTVLAILGSGCGGNDSVGPNDGDGPGGVPQNVDSIVKIANDSLGRQMNHMINITIDNPDSTFRPDELDFSGLNNLYQQALSINSANRDARFGVAYTNLLMFFVDPALNDLIDRLKFVVDTSSFGPSNSMPAIMMGGEMVPNGIPLNPERFTGLFPDLTRLDYSIMSTAASDPTLSELQDIIETNLLPRIDDAMMHLKAISSDREYTFIVTPAMQGNIGANPIIIDRSDFMVFLATCYAAKAAIQVFLARNLDPISYDVVGANAALQPGNPFLDLRPGDHMSAAKASILSTARTAKLALEELISEARSGQDQANDLIKVRPNNVHELQQAIDSIDFYVTYFDGPKKLNIIWTRGSYWDCNQFGCWRTVEKDTVSAMVDISKFFDAPMDNPKNFIPSYTASLTELPVDTRLRFADQHFSRVRLDSAFKSVFGVGTSEVSLADSIWKYNKYSSVNYQPLPATNTTEFYSLLANNYYAYTMGWEGFESYCSQGSRDLWCYGSDYHYKYKRLYNASVLVEACFGWTAATYAEWTWPKPEFNGLLPGTTSDIIKNWINETPPVWHQSVCDTLRF